MKIACLQLAPEMGKGEANMRKADEILSQTQPGELDLLVLPEMAFSGDSIFFDAESQSRKLSLIQATISRRLKQSPPF